MQPKKPTMNDLSSLVNPEDGRISIETAKGIAAQMGRALKAKKAAMDAGSKSALGSQSPKENGRLPKETDSSDSSGSSGVR